MVVAHLGTKTFPIGPWKEAKSLQHGSASTRCLRVNVWNTYVALTTVGVTTASNHAAGVKNSLFRILVASNHHCPTLKPTAVHGTLCRGTSHLVTLFWLTLRCCTAVAPPAPTAVVVQSPFACMATTLFMHRGLLASQQFHSHLGCRFN